MTTPKERPILFSGEMVRAILDGRKTQTRRVVKPQPPEGGLIDWFMKFDDEIGTWQIVDENRECLQVIYCPYGNRKERLWVREKLVLWPGMAEYDADGEPVKVAEENWGKEQNFLDNYQNAIAPSIHMPRWASRITLEITSVRVERVQSINQEDAQAEGVAAWHDTIDGTVYVPEFKMLWDKINGKRPGCSWADNPWVWALTFQLL